MVGKSIDRFANDRIVMGGIPWFYPSADQSTDLSESLTSAFQRFSVSAFYSAREIVFATGFDVALAIGGFQIFFPPKSVLLVKHASW
jgi:hypothetical protein